MPVIHKIEHPIVEGVRIGKQGRNGSYRINTTCIVYRLGDTIIDTGPSNQWQYVKRFLEEKGVRQALITHYHEDHSGNGGNISCCFNAAIHSHHHNHHKLSNGYKLNLSSRLIFGNITLVDSAHFPERLELEDRRQLQAIHLPGHSDDMTCFYEPEQGWFFSGDLYVSSKVRYAHKEENISQQIASLKAALNLDFKEMFCAHQGLLADGKQALRNKLNYLVELQAEVKHLQQQGLSEREMQLKLLGREDTVAYASTFDMSKRNLIRACLK